MAAASAVLQFPTLALRRSAIATDYDVFHGDPVASLVEAWIENAAASRVQTLTPHLFPQLLFDAQFRLLFIDFFAPVCVCGGGGVRGNGVGLNRSSFVV